MLKSDIAKELKNAKKEITSQQQTIDSYNENIKRLDDAYDKKKEDILEHMGRLADHMIYKAEDLEKESAEHAVVMADNFNKGDLEGDHDKLMRDAYREYQVCTSMAKAHRDCSFIIKDGVDFQKHH